MNAAVLGIAERKLQELADAARLSCTSSKALAGVSEFILTAMQR
jgi:organic hydroperoxide reductase OsmC/OhrA